jgi:hypothetical protein
MFYSQFRQDEFLENIIFNGYKNGVFMDVGAHNGVSLNNTLYFEKNNNWSGVNIEPIKKVFDELVINRPNCININCAVSNFDGISEFLCNEGYTEMISGLKNSFDPRHTTRLLNENQKYGSTTKTIDVDTKRIETICDEYNIKHINYLSIDVEGGEFNVIKSINFDKLFIDVIGFENNYADVSTPIMEYLNKKNFITFVDLSNKPPDILMINKDSEFIKQIHTT